MGEPVTAKIVEWDRKRGFGYLGTGDRRTFLHIRDFSELSRAPGKGDRIRFHQGRDRRGRPCAVRAVQVGGRVRGAAITLLGLAILLLLPGASLLLLPLAMHIVAGYALLVSIVTIALYIADKNKSRRGDWRIPEITLHGMEALGGWPGALVAQRHLRHKCAKRSYQVRFWLIVAAYQLLALDALSGWKVVQSGWSACQQLATFAVHEIATEQR